MKHTPGQWTAHAQASANNYVILQDNNWVAAIQFNGEMMPAKQEEYLNTMAAARDMLAALRTMVRGMESQHSFALDNARAAIAKATWVAA